MQISDYSVVHHMDIKIYRITNGSEKSYIIKENIDGPSYPDVAVKALNTMKLSLWILGRKICKKYISLNICQGKIVP